MKPPKTMRSDVLARHVITSLNSSGFQAFLVGGCVRDLLLGRQPKDFDVATDARPDEVLALFPKANLVGAVFGVVLVAEADETVEVATFRSDGEYHDGRRPDRVRYESDPRADALRRDFTINALFLDVTNERVLDFVGGLEDLGAKVIRAIGVPEERFREDHLRLLRAVRFAARLGFEIEPRTWQSMRSLAPLVKTVATERVRDELTRILTEGGARPGLEMLDASGLLVHWLPEIAAMKGVEQPPEFHPEGDVWTHTLLVMEKLLQPAATLAWGALLHDVGKPPTLRVADRIRFDGHVEEGVAIAHRILTRLRFPGNDIEQIQALIANHMKFMHVRAMRESTLKRFVRQSRFHEHLALHHADVLSSNGQLAAYNYVKERIAELTSDQLKPEPLVTGHDLIAMGYQPGPRFGQILAALEDAQLEGLLANREEAFKWVTRRYSKLDSSPMVT